jgi:hypothetical protein
VRGVAAGVVRAVVSVQLMVVVQFLTSVLSV